MERRFSYSDFDDPYSFLTWPDQPYVSDNAFTRNQGNTSPWNALPRSSPVDVIDTDMLYPAYQAGTYHQSSSNTVPGYIQHSPGMNEALLSSSPSTTGLPPSNSVSPASQDNQLPETRPRGGRRPGMNLTEELVNNVRRVRQVGACLRCAACKERCSTEMPCKNCAHTEGRKWEGCVRSFTELVDAFKPGETS